MFTFRHFGRNEWSLFAVLGRELRIGVLSVATIATAAPTYAGIRTTSTAEETADSFQKAANGEEPSDTLALTEATVTAQRTPMAADKAARQVTTLSAKELAAAGVASINDVLKLAAGVDIRQRGAMGIQTDISIDGGTFDQITILVNGVAVSNPQTGHNVEFPLTLADVERIEILEGGATRVAGSQAFSGAVNIVTRRDAGSEVRLSAGSCGTVMSGGRTAMRKERVIASLSVAAGRSDGAVDNGDWAAGRFFGTLRYDDSRLTLAAQTGASLQNFGANTFYSAAYPDQWESTRRYMVSVTARTKGRIGLAPSVAWLRNTDHYQLIRHTPTGENFHRSDVATLGLTAWTKWKAGTTSLGAELRDEQVYSSSLGRELPEPLRFSHYMKHDARTNLSFFAEHHVAAGPLTLNFGAMLLRNSALDQRFRIYPGIDAALRLRQGWKIFASWNKSLRLPTFTDLWYKSPTLEGNVGLSPEKNSAFRLGTDWRRHGLRLAIKAHYSRCTDIIDWAMFTPDDVYHATNVSLRRMGASADITLHIGELLGRRQPLGSLRMQYAYLHQKKTAGREVFKSNYALEHLRHKLTVVLDHRVWSRLSAAWTLRVGQRCGGYEEYAGGKPTGRRIPYGTHVLLDTRLRWTAHHYELFADFSNLTSHRYYDLGNVRQPGFVFLSGAKVMF